MTTIAEVNDALTGFEKSGVISFDERQKLVEKIEQLGIAVETQLSRLAEVQDAPHPPELVGQSVSGAPNGEVVTGGAGGSGNTTIADQSFDAVFGFEKTNIHANGSKVELRDINLENGWSREGDVISYEGTPDKVEISISLNAFDEGLSNYWSRPKMRVLRGKETIAVFDDLVMQQNSAYDGDATINAQVVDKQPGENPGYTLEWFDKESRRSVLPPQEYSRMCFSAVNKIKVFAP